MGPVLGFIIFVIQSATCFNGIMKFFSITMAWQFVLLGVMILSYTLNFLLSKMPKYRAMKKLYSNRTKVLEMYVEQYIAQMKEQNCIELRINVMKPRNKFFVSLEPCKGKRRIKLAFRRKMFRTIWSSNNMIEANDRSLEFTENQGVCGIAYSKNMRVEVVTEDMTADECIEAFCLSSDQYEKTKELKVIFSCPIRKAVGSKKVLGVVNIDSKSQGSDQLFDHHRDDLNDRLNAITEICRIISIV